MSSKGSPLAPPPAKVSWSNSSRFPLVPLMLLARSHLNWFCVRQLVACTFPRLVCNSLIFVPMLIPDLDRADLLFISLFFFFENFSLACSRLRVLQRKGPRLTIETRGLFSSTSPMSTVLAPPPWVLNRKFFFHFFSCIASRSSCWLSQPTSSRVSGLNRAPFRGLSSRFVSQTTVPFPGLRNLGTEFPSRVLSLIIAGNTCYLNAALQVLFFAPTFRDYLNDIHARIEKGLAGVGNKSEDLEAERNVVRELVKLWDEVVRRGYLLLHFPFPRFALVFLLIWTVKF